MKAKATKLQRGSRPRAPRRLTSSPAAVTFTTNTSAAHSIFIEQPLWLTGSVTGNSPARR